MIWRSLLYVPATVPRFLDKAQTRGADALILDLEDSVPDTAKGAGRKALAERWDKLAEGPSDLLVRINSEPGAAAQDLEAVVRPGLAALYLPKVTGAGDVQTRAAQLDRLEVARGLPLGYVRLVAMIETPAALEDAFAIAAAHPRLIGMILGSEDFAETCGMTPTPEHLFGPRQRIVMASRAAGIAPLGLLDSAANLDTAGLADLVSRSRQAGFVGASVVHPAAIAALNTGFLPDAAQIAWARRVLASLDEAERIGAGAARLDGRMIDRPVRLRAESILLSAGAGDGSS